jgi:NAD(P)-dependent dehydrogenase (short-subunit alcohol dehydrogenase family)
MNPFAESSAVSILDLPLDGMAAFVTGGGTGIGLACAQRLARDGATVTICGRRGDVLERAVSTLGAQGRMIVCDVTDDAQVAAAVAFASSSLGRLDIAVANAVVPRPLVPSSWPMLLAGPRPLRST